MIAKKSKFSVVSVVLVAAVCAPAWAQVEAPASAPVPDATPVAPHTGLDRSLPVILLTVAPYQDEDGIANKVIEECTELGTQLSESTAKYLVDKGMQVQRQPSVDLKSAKQALNVKITSAVSAGNAFIGHRKSVSIRAELYKDGVLVAKTGKTRDSAGGAFGGFKSSCGVLERTVNTLGNDVAKWLAGLR
jgi:hypothetical protein